ncbi:DUF2779 domain-containing protein [Acholeplasma equirhinis]|uniref:DUF2779 domain-containing protein n=1 Tax=Acholeplasma equirhinis TaxID=555393 RepID=UPI00197AD97C|nr:DUF2779 domain-containing protein [Acholeplasma equirhinis]MBN3490902.1 DUF2779 domain-containing protein [Acholeplasma equirhinis]
MSKLINKISKTRFINGINCPRFFPLFEIYKKKQQATVAFKEDLSDLMEEENMNNIKMLLQSMYEEAEDEDGDITEIDKINVTDEQLEVMMPYYKKIETYSAVLAEHLFNAPVIHDFDTKKQKMVEAEIGDYKFYSFLDGYQETDKNIHIIESKATTTNKFYKLTYKSEDGEKLPIFEESPSGILMTREALGLPVDGTYYKQIEKMLNRLHDAGSYIYDLTYQRYVIEHGAKLDKPVRYFLSVLNSEYIFDGVYKDNEPDFMKDLGENQFIMRLIDVTDLTEKFLASFQMDVDTVIDRLDHMTYDLENPGPLCPRKGKHKCMFHDICYAHVPKKNSVFTYKFNHLGFKDEQGEKHSTEDLINMGMKKVLDVPYNWLQRPINQIQYNVVSTQEPHMNKKRIAEIISKMQYPLYHLDFESFPCPLPRFKGEKPYTQSLFQFNLHIEHAPGVCDKDKDSYYYLATDAKDQREALCKAMVDLIGDIGTVIAWNDSFETTRMKELATYFPQYKAKLDSMIARTFDLMYILSGSYHKIYPKWGLSEMKEVNYYHEDLQGSYSIKKVLPIFVPSLSYKNLEIGNGTQALVTYAKFPRMTPKEFKQKYDALVTYCKQDTWAMVEILNSLRKMVQSV